MAGNMDHADGAPGGPGGSRRGLLAGALAAESMTAAAPAAATQGCAVILGQDNTGAIARTRLFATSGETALLADPSTRAGVSGTGGSGGATGVIGTGGGRQG